MAEDKIFNNSYGSSEIDHRKIEFTIAPAFGSSMDPDDRIHYDLLLKKIDELIIGSEFEELNKVTENGVAKKLNKVQINKVYFYVIDKIGHAHTRIDLFGVLSDYFDVFPNKFYNSLSNKFKDELILELDKKYNILEKKKIRKLF
jgi:hypothetical protein